MTAAALEHEPPRRVVRRCYEAPLGTFRPITFPPTYEALFAAVAWDDPADPAVSRLTLSCSSSAHDWTTVRDIGPERDWGDAAPPAVLLKRSAVQVNPDSVIKLALGILALAGSLTSLVVGLFFRR